jgi:hypothetical protein
MRITHIVTVATTTTNNVALHNRGELALTNHYETCVQLGGITTGH